MPARRTQVISILTLSWALLTEPATFAAEPDVQRPGGATPPAAKTQPLAAAQHPAGRFTISRETTWITEPLTSDGFPDYLERFNQKNSQGVTPQNNAAAVIWQIVGPPEKPDPLRVEYFRRLGISIPPPKGDYLLEPEQWLAKQQDAKHSPEDDERIKRESQLALIRPWTAKEYPELAQWLTASDGLLNKAVEMSRLPKYYSPLLSNSKSSRCSEAYPGPTSEMMRVARGLRQRAMYRLGQQDVAGAWRDIVAVQRLAGLVSQGADKMYGRFVSIHLVPTVVAFCHYGRFTPQQAMRGRDEFAAQLIPFDFWQQWHGWERCVFLDAVCCAAREDPALVDAAAGKPVPPDAGAYDWDLVMRRGNQIINQHLGVKQIANPREQLERLTSLNRDLIEARNSGNFPGAILLAGRQLRSEKLAVNLLSINVAFMGVIFNNHLRFETTDRMTSVVFTLAAYRAEHGEYPKQLDSLVPKYIAALPVDAFGNVPLCYERTREGFRLWSCGLDGKDDGGLQFGEDFPANGRPGDDVRIDVPPLPPPAY
jgi:hypothetical protein